MNTKIIYFRPKSAAGPFAATDGEIESASNVQLLSSTGLILSPDGQLLSNNGLVQPNPDKSGSGSSPNDPIGADNSISSGQGGSGENCGGESPIYLPAKELQLLNDLSSRLLPIVEFALQPAVVAGWHNHPDINPSIKIEAPKTKDTDGWRAKASEALSKFLKTADAAHLAVSPFLALSALRLTDGSHILPSSPVLLLPNTSAPNLEGPDDLSVDSMTLSITAKAGRLRCRVAIEPGLLALSDRIEALDIFISAPLPLYDAAAPLLASHRAAGSTAPLSWLTTPLTDSEFTARLLSTVSFRMISSIPLKELPDYASFTDVNFNVPELTDVAEVSAFKPDFLQHQSITAATGCSFSGRLTLADLTLTLPAPPPAATLMPHENSSLSPAAVEIESVKQGLTLHASAFNPTHPNVNLSDTNLPKWIFIPDPDARKIIFITSSATYIFPFKRHPLLNGAFYWCGATEGCGLADSPGVKKLSVPLPTPLPAKYLNRDSYRLPGAIWRSAKGSTLRFPDGLLMNPETDRVIALCRAFRASGLVATTSPTAYLFTTRGIYLLKEMDDGTLRDAGLIANYILSSPSTLISSGTTLYFTAISTSSKPAGADEPGGNVEPDGADVTAGADETAGADGSTGADVTDGADETDGDDVTAGRLTTLMQISGTTVKPVSGSLNNSGSASSAYTKWLLTAEDPSLPISLITRPIKLTTINPALASSPESSFPQLHCAEDAVRSLSSRLLAIELLGAFTPHPEAPNTQGLPTNAPNPQELSSEATEAQKLPSNAPNPQELSSEAPKAQKLPLEIKLYGSADLYRWHLLAQTQGKRMLRTLRTHGIRHLRLELSGHLSGSLEALALHTPS